jgi:hypothetical protein
MGLRRLNHGIAEAALWREWLALGAIAGQLDGSDQPHAASFPDERVIGKSMQALEESF